VALGIALGTVHCRERVTPQPDPVASSDAAPVASASSSAGGQAQKASWRTSPNELFGTLRQRCEGGAAEACWNALVIGLEGDQWITSMPLDKANAADLPRLAKRGCDLGNKPSCTYLRRDEVNQFDFAEKRMQRAAWVREICDAAGDPMCLVFHTGGMTDPNASVAACNRGIGTDCYVIASEAPGLNSPYADHLRYARKACDAYIQTCLRAIETLAAGHPERYASPDVRAMRERIATEQSKRCVEGHPVCGQAALAHLELGHDPGEARRYAEAGLADKDQLANYVLGRLTDEGTGTPADPGKAAEFYKNCGDVEIAREHVCHARLAAQYEAGRGVPKDLKIAFGHARDARFPGRTTPTLLRYFRLLQQQDPVPSRDQVLARAKMECSGEDDQRCRILWKLIEEGKPIPESLPDK